jgi:hypothetical protein
MTFMYLSIDWVNYASTSSEPSRSFCRVLQSGTSMQLTWSEESEKILRKEGLIVTVEK